MSSTPLKPMKLILPGLFLLALGVGNIGVGSFKAVQYHQVVEELSSLQQGPGLDKASTLRRVQMSEAVTSRHYERLSTARARLDFYQLVAYGGKVFVGLSVVLLVGGALLYYGRCVLAAERCSGDSAKNSDSLDTHSAEPVAQSM